MSELLTTRQVQTLLRVDRTTIYRMVEGGRLPAVRVGKQWRFPKEEVERYLRVGPFPSIEADHSARRPVSREGALVTGRPADLRSLLPEPCSQLVQDAFADLLGVMMVITDMQGRPVTEVSNPCGLFSTLTAGSPNATGHCVRTWQQLAGNLSLEPRWSLSEMGLLCARGLIRTGSELMGMVVMGGVAPETWPMPEEQMAALAVSFGLEPSAVAGSIDAVFRLDRAAEERALRSVQRIADIFSHMAEARVPGRERPAAEIP